MNKQMKKLLLLLNSTDYKSGTELGVKLGLTRSSVWKLINQIKELGVSIESKTNSGYRFSHPIELLDKKIISKYLSTNNQYLINNMVILEDVSSTNTYLLQEPFNNEKKISICLAEAQNNGRGRLGRNWCSPFGKNLYMSIGCNFTSGVKDISGITLAIAVAVAETLNLYIRSKDIGIKWPNDIYWQNRKLAGILSEIKGEGYSMYRIIVGVGINLSMEQTYSQYISQPWVNLEEIINKTPERNRIAGLVLNQIIENIKIFQKYGLMPFLKSWEKYDIFYGKKVILSTPREIICGINSGIDEHGYLLIKDDQNEIKKFAVGEISMRDAKIK